MSETAGSKRIAILGGTGALGTGLVRRWTQAGHAVIIGSRTLEKAEAALYALLAERLPHATIVSIGHRHSLRRFHLRELFLDRDPASGEPGRFVDRPILAGT